MTRSISTWLKAHYALGTTSIATCWKATLTDGTVVAATTHHEPIVFAGVKYEPTIGYNPSDVENSSDLSFDNLEVDGFLMAPSLTVDDVRSGRWDYALIELFEVNYRDLGAGRNLIRKGRLGQVRAGRTVFTAELRGMTQHYSRRIVELTSQECRANLGDSRCKIDLTNWDVWGKVDSVTDNKIIHDAMRTEVADWYTGGLLTFTSGRNRGLSFEVKSYTPGVLTLFVEPPNEITAANTPTSVPVGSGSSPSLATPDAYTVYAGCQKRFYQDCIGKFNNALNFQGEPHAPGAGIYGGPGTKMTPATVPGSAPSSPPAPTPGSPPAPPPPAPTPSPGLPPASAGSGTGNIKFASRLTPYAAGVIAPSDTTTAMDAFVKSQYDSWVANILKSTSVGFGSIPAGGYWVQKSSTDLTVSEGIGYGMLITVVMAGYDPDAQVKFDGLLKTARAFPSGNYSWLGSGGVDLHELMSWRVNPDGTDGGGAWPALDGDLDMALALLMADAQWGSTGTWNYRAIALAMIATIKAYAFNSNGVIVTTAGVTHVGRTSDYMFGHFRAFRKYTGDTFWDNAVSEQKRIVNYIQTHFAPSTGLLPDWVGGADTLSPFPTTDVQDGWNPHKDAYWFNACRDPWRMGADFVLTGDPDMKTFLTRMSAFFESSSGGVVSNLINGYALDGTGLVANNAYWIASEFYNPMLVGALCDARFQAWANTLWTYSKAHPETGYYGTEIQLLCAFIASGNWWTP